MILFTFLFPVLQIIKEAQQQHGLRHGDFQRYRYISQVNPIFCFGPLNSEISITRQFGIMVLYLTSLKRMVRIQNNLTEIIFSHISQVFPIFCLVSMNSEISITRQFGIIVLYLTSPIQNNLTEIVLR